MCDSCKLCALQISVDYGLLFVVTKYGYLYMCDMETAMCLCCTRVAVDVIFAAVLNTNTQGILAITRGGQVSADCSSSLSSSSH